MNNSFCDICSIKEICIVYKDVLRHSAYADITLSNCKHRQINRNIVDKNIDHSFGNRSKETLDKINELSNKKRLERENNKKTIEKKPKPIVTAEPLKLDHICKSCNGTTFKEDAGKCQGDNCDKDICSCCATIDGDTNRLLCPDCWAKS